LHTRSKVIYFQWLKQGKMPLLWGMPKLSRLLGRTGICKAGAPYTVGSVAYPCQLLPLSGVSLVEAWVGVHPKSEERQEDHSYSSSAKPACDRKTESRLPVCSQPAFRQHGARPGWVMRVVEAASWTCLRNQKQGCENDR